MKDTNKSVYLKDDIILQMADTFKIFGDSTRIKILYSIYNSERCVQDISKLINMSQSAVSHQLSILKKVRLVKANRIGKEIFYSLDDSHIKEILSVGLEHIEERG